MGTALFVFQPALNLCCNRFDICNLVSAGNVFQNRQSVMEKADCPNLDQQCDILQLPFTALLITLLPPVRYIRTWILRRVRISSLFGK